MIENMVGTAISTVVSVLGLGLVLWLFQRLGRASSRTLMAITVLVVMISGSGLIYGVWWALQPLE